MTKTDPSKTYNEDKFNFDERARELDAQNLFARPDIPPGIGLRQFLARETESQQRTSMFESCSSETLAPGVYIRKQANGTWELLVRHTRGTFLAYYGTKEELLDIAEQKIGERDDIRNHVR